MYECFCKLEQTLNTLNPSNATALFTAEYRGTIYACNCQSKPGHAWKANGVFVSNPRLEINFTRCYTSAKYFVALHLLIYKLEELTLN